MDMYIGMRFGAPQPITVMKVGVGRARRDSGEMVEERVRRKSWQFWDRVVLVDLVWCVGVWVGRDVGLTPQKKCRINIISCRGATCGAS